jgi:hypothetical protein
MREPKVGDNIFSKNGTEFNCNIISIRGNVITVEYSDNYEEHEMISIAFLKSCDYMEDSQMWDVPNWTFNFEQLNNDCDDD